MQGFLTGLGTAFFLGPVFFTILRNTDKHGTPAGIATALGILLSDIIIVIICMAFTKEFVENQLDKPWLKWAAAAVLLVLSYRFLSNPNKEDQASNNVRLGSGKFISFYQGFLVNFVNPFVFVVWIGFISLAYSVTDSNYGFYTYIGAILLGILVTDLIKVFATKYILLHLQENWVSYLYKLLGILLLVAAIRLMLMALNIV